MLKQPLSSLTVMVCTGGNPASSASMSSATCGSRFTRTAGRPMRWLERDAAWGRRAGDARAAMLVPLEQAAAGGLPP